MFVPADNSCADSAAFWVFFFFQYFPLFSHAYISETENIFVQNLFFQSRGK